MTRAASIFITLILAATLVGCAGLTRLHQEVALKTLIHRTYKDEANQVPAQYARDFERGWKQAYYNVSKGADACPPSTPPQEYWSVKYQNPDGCRKIAAWYQGYQYGVIAAERDWRPQFANVPLSSICYRPGATACLEVPELRSESAVAEPTGDGAGEAKTAMIQTRAQTGTSIDLSSYVADQRDQAAPAVRAAWGQMQRLPPIEPMAEPTH